MSSVQGTDPALDSFEKKYLWYIEAALPLGPPLQGTAIKLRLRAPGDKDFFNYLLTCRHVVCKIKETPDGLLATELPIRCWRGGGLYHNDYAFVATVSKLTQTPTEPIARLDASNDWVLLKIEDKGASTEDKTPLPYADVDGSGHLFQVLGYAGGMSKLLSGDQDKKERWVTRSDVLSLRLDNAGLGNCYIRLTGAETAKGMSGGPVIDDDGNVVGIHRAAYEKWICKESTRLSSILLELRENGCELPPPLPRQKVSPFWDGATEVFVYFGLPQAYARRTVSVTRICLTKLPYVLLVLILVVAVNTYFPSPKSPARTVELLSFLDDIAEDHQTADWQTMIDRENKRKSETESHISFTAVLTSVSSTKTDDEWTLRCSPKSCAGIERFYSVVAITLPDRMFPTTMDRSALEPLGNRYRIVNVSMKIDGFVWDPKAPAGLVSGLATAFEVTDNWITCTPSKNNQN
ncbi:MAG: serine protease [Pseudomonadota bacterium]